MRNIFFLTFCCFLFCHCTITKRVHKAGWHVSSNKSWSTGHTKDKEKIRITETTPIKPTVVFPKTISLLEHKQVLKNNLKKNPQKTRNNEFSKGEKNGARTSNVPKKQSILNPLNTSPSSLMIEQNDTVKEKEPNERKIPLWVFIVLISLLLLLGSLVIGILWMFAYTSLIYGAFSGGILLNVLAALIVSIPTVTIYYALFYLLFYLFYNDDPYYLNKEDFKSDFWKIASIFLLILTGLILIVIFGVLANIW